MFWTDLKVHKNSLVSVMWLVILDKKESNEILVRQCKSFLSFPYSLSKLSRLHSQPVPMDYFSPSAAHGNGNALA